MQRLDRRGGVDAEFACQCPAQPLVHLQRLALSPAPVEGDHQVFGDVLVVGVLAQQRGQLLDDLMMTPQVEFDAQAQFVRGRALLVQPCRIELQDPAGDVDQRVTAPAGQRAPQRDSRLERGLVLFGEMPLMVELQQVELIGGQVDLVAAAPRADQGTRRSARGKVAAQTGNSVLDLTDRGGGCLPVPHHGDEPFHGDEVVGIDQKRGQHLGLPRPVQPDLAPGDLGV